MNKFVFMFLRSRVDFVLAALFSLSPILSFFHSFIHFTYSFIHSFIGCFSCVVHLVKVKITQDNAQSFDFIGGFSFHLHQLSVESLSLS